MLAFETWAFMLNLDRAATVTFHFDRAVTWADANLVLLFAFLLLCHRYSS